MRMKERRIDRRKGSESGGNPLVHAGLCENSSNRARLGQGLLTRARKPGEMLGVLTEYRRLSALPRSVAKSYGRGSQKASACSRARFRAGSFHTDSDGRGCSENTAWRTRGRTALSTRHRAVFRFVCRIMAWDSDIRPLDETGVTPEGLRFRTDMCCLTSIPDSGSEERM